MKQGSILIYDGTWDGFLTCVFTVFEQKMVVTAIYSDPEMQQDIFAKPEIITTESNKAKRVISGMANKLPSQARKELFFAYLSEKPGIELLLLRYLLAAFRDQNFSSKDYANSIVLDVVQIAKQVSREKHRMEAFVRFKLTKDEVFFAHIEPDFNVLPLILTHFQSRYANQRWIIYDLKRKFGLFYDLHKTTYISLELDENIFLERNIHSIYGDAEMEFQKLWQQYFKSTNITSRKNLKLHLQHVPKRYWKYLTEKS